MVFFIKPIKPIKMIGLIIFVCNFGSLTSPY